MQRSWILGALGTVLLFGSLVLSLLSTAPLTWTQRVLMRHRVFQRKNGRVVGVGNHQGTSALLDLPLAGGLFSQSVYIYQVVAFTCSCITHVPDVRIPRSGNFEPSLTSVFHAFCPCILNISLRETQINIERLLIKEPYQVSGTPWYAAAQ